MWKRGSGAAGVLVLMAACGGGSGGGSPTSGGRLLSVGGDYSMVVALAENTCGAVTVQPLPTRVEHTAGASSFRLTHGPLTYSGTLAADGAFTTAAQTVADAAGPQTITLAGRFITTGLEAQVEVAVQRTALGACRYVVRWTGTKQGAANVIP
jgi:hypothetical protein